MGKTYSSIFGYIFLLIGFLGFFTNPIISNDISSWFLVDLNANLIHILSGFILLGAAYIIPFKSGSVMKVLGVAYLIIALMGFLLIGRGGSMFGLIQVNRADHYLHFILGLLVLLMGIKASARTIGR